MARKLPTGPQEVVRVPAGPYPTPPHQYSQEEKMVHMAVLVLSLAILWSLCTSLLRRVLGHGQEVHPTPWRVNVLLLTSEPAELPDILNRTLIACEAPQCLQVKVLVECTRGSEVWNLQSHSLRALCRISNVKARPGATCAGRARRLLRHFGNQEDVDFTLLMDSRVELTRGWDAKIYALLQERTQDRSSAPRQGGLHDPPVPHPRAREWPERPLRSLLRDGSRHDDPYRVLVFRDVGRTTGDAPRWGAALRPSDGAWASTTKHHRIPTTVLCTALCNPRCFEQEDVGADVHVTRSMELGLSDNASVRERILKFGSTQAADVALHG